MRDFGMRDFGMPDFGVHEFRSSATTRPEAEL
jgi:hypothetical protein